MTEANSQRVERQKQAPITVIIGNPPYNVGQANENDNNKNRKYDVIDGRIRETYAKDSKATNRNALSDAYVKFFRWAADRLGERDGIVCYVSNNSFVDQIAFDGMRGHLLKDFTCVYHIDLHGNIRQNPKLSGTTHNVFGIQVGVGITLAIRSSAHENRNLYYYRVPEDWRKEEKLGWLSSLLAPTPPLPTNPTPLPVHGEGLGVGFFSLANAGRHLADLHLNYEQIDPYPLQWIEAKNVPLSYRVEKMRLSKDKTQVVVNDSLTLAGIPPQVFEYRLGNRSALDWVIDQYQVTADKRSGITSDPNRDDEPRYIVDLVGRVITVSLETVKIVAALPEKFVAEMSEVES